MFVRFPEAKSPPVHVYAIGRALKGCALAIPAVPTNPVDNATIMAAQNRIRDFILGALFKTPFDCEEEKSAGGVVRFAVGTIWAAVVGVEDPPGLEMPEDSFDGRPQSRDDSVISFISLAERAAGGLLSGSGHAAALVAFVSDAAAGAPHDFGNGRLIER